MFPKNHQRLKSIRFEGELLPDWAQLLDLAGRLCPVPAETRDWFSRLTNSAGVDDARTVLAQCELLRTNLRQHQEALLNELKRRPDDPQPAQIYAAWMYALETMIQQASARETCSWQIDGLKTSPEDDSGTGDITLRRV